MSYDVNDSRGFESLTEAEQEQLLAWINKNFICMNTFNTKRSSYYIKHLFEKENFYVTNGQFKGAMLKAGFKVKNPDSDNWYFNISMRSPAFRNENV